MYIFSVLQYNIYRVLKMYTADSSVLYRKYFMGLFLKTKNK